MCGLATTTLFLTLARAGQGIGGASMFATSLAMLASAFHGRDRGVAFGVYGATTGVAVAVGPVLGGAITTGLSWRWIFLVNVPIGVARVGITLLRVAESRDPRARRPDWLGFVTFSAGLGALVFGLIRSGADGWSSGTVTGSLVASGVLLAAFVAVEAWQRAPMLDLTLFRSPAFVGALAAAFGISGAVFAMLTYLVLYFQNILGYSALATGVRFLALSAAVFVTAVIAGRLTSRVPSRWLIGPGFLAAGVRLLLMHGVTTGSGWTHMLPGFILAAARGGMVNVPLASVAVAVVGPARARLASGGSSTFPPAGNATGLAGLANLFT